MTIYIRRNGPMWFWRIGRLGGSIYWARNPKVDDELALKRQKRAIMRRRRDFGLS